MRVKSDAYYQKLSHLECKQLLERYMGDCSEIYETLEIMQRKITQYEMTRYITTWHDGSTVENQCHLLFMVCTTYDSAVYFTDEEWKTKTNEIISVQKIIEAPQLYMIGRCAGSDSEQLSYGETRLECLAQMEQPIEDEQGFIFTDKMRFFKGMGQQ